MAMFFAMLSQPSVFAQEIKCDIRVNSSQIAGTDKHVFENLQSALYEFINNTKWTNINFKTAEKIECSIAITLKERTSGDSYTAEINMALRRPTYKASYTTPLFNYVDKNFNFTYSDGIQLDFNPSTYMSDLTSTIAFYIYMFLGYDFDTFSLNGGDNFYAVAEAIVNSAQNTNEIGWLATNRQNRYWLVENMRNNSYQPLRQFLYEYHRLGLDVMSEKPDEGRAAICNTLQNLQRMYDSYPTCFYLQLLIETKRDEIIKVFSEGTQQEKTKAVNIMKAIDASKANEYDAILNGGRKN